LTRIPILCAAALAVAAMPPAPARAQDAGQAEFLASCSACHQPTGQGIKGAFPPLAGSAFVQGDPATVAALVLNGRGGMPSFRGDLNDARIAAALSYVRSAWGNRAGPITADQVAAARAGGAAAPPKGLQAH
jgi:mono/diheme cytochrome c family protein